MRIRDPFAAMPFSFMLGVASLLLFASVSCERAKVFRIGIVNANARHESVVNGFKSGLAGAGFVEGRNVIYYYGKDILPLSETGAVLKELVDKKVDLIFVTGTPTARKAKEVVEGTRIPVVFAPVLYPVESGLVESLRHPGGNLTGISAGGSTLKALEWHKTAMPGRRYILVPCKCTDEAAQLSWSELQDAAVKLGVRLVLSEVGSVADLKDALDNIPRGVDSLWLLNSPFLVPNVDLFSKAATRHRLAFSSGTSQYMEGVMVSYGQNLFRAGEQAARMAHMILRGASPSELPVERTEFFLGINLRAARAARIEIADDVLRQADEIIR